MSLFSSRNLGCFAAIVFLAFTLVVLPGFPRVRTILSAPLVIHDPNAGGDACYVLAGGGSLWERLDAAADLVNTGRVTRIYMMKDNQQGQYNFKADRSWTRAEWSSDYLAWRGISTDRISYISPTDDYFGTLAETRAFAEHFPKDLSRLVLVSSAPHMRRSVLAFRRSLPPNVLITPYAATSFMDSYEMRYPIWIEYVKLFVYYLIS